MKLQMNSWFVCSTRWVISLHLSRLASSRNLLYHVCFVGLDKGRLEIYVMVAGLNYDLIFDYATQLWEEFGVSISHINVANGVSCARY